MNCNLTQKAYRYIHSKLCEGQLRPGSRLSNRGIAKEVGISFTPIREALNRLVSEGLLEYRQGIGVFVPILSQQEIREIYELREIIESEVASQIASTAPAAMLAEMSQYCNHMARIFEKVFNVDTSYTFNDLASEWQTSDSMFHMSLLRASGNRRMLNTIEDLQTLIKAMMLSAMRTSTAEADEPHWMAEHYFLSESRSQMERILTEHRHILRALEQGDSKTVKAVTIQHIRTGLEGALEAYHHKHMGETTPFPCGAHLH